MIDEATYTARRNRMVDGQIVRRGIKDNIVIEAMRKVPRHLFVDEEFRSKAYADSPLPIGCSQTISQPYIVASMTEQLMLSKESRLLEIGTGCGYQTAILAEIVKEVFTIERVGELQQKAEKLLKRLMYESVSCRLGDGSEGWWEAAPFDAIIVTAAAKSFPEALIEQLKPGGRLIIPLSFDMSEQQELTLFTRTSEGYRRTVLYDVRFVPLLSGTKPKED